MPRADYRCPTCDRVLEHVFRMRDGAVASAPACSNCSDETHLVLMVWIPAARFDVKSDGDGDTGFQKFEVSRLVPTRDGPQQITEVVDSLHKVRQIEKDSEQRYRDGEGEPLRFRAYAQGRSNTDQGLFGTEGRIGSRTYDSGRTPQKTGKVGVTRHGTTKPKVRAARGGGASPLG